jgi:hypothetical protein
MQPWRCIVHRLTSVAAFALMDPDAISGRLSLRLRTLFVEGSRDIKLPEALWFRLAPARRRTRMMALTFCLESVLGPTRLRLLLRMSFVSQTIGKSRYWPMSLGSTSRRIESTRLPRTPIRIRLWQSCTLEVPGQIQELQKSQDFASWVPFSTNTVGPESIFVLQVSNAPGSTLEFLRSRRLQ